MKEKHLTVLIYDKEFFKNVWINNIYNSIIKWQITKLDSKHPHVLSSFMWISRTGKIISDRKQISGWTWAHGYRRDCLKNSSFETSGGKKKCSVSWMGWWFHDCMPLSKITKRYIFNGLSLLCKNYTFKSWFKNSSFL